MKKQNLLSILWCHITTFDPASIYQFKMLKLDSADILNLIMVLWRYEPTSNTLKDVTNLNSSTESSKYYLQTSYFYIYYLHCIITIIDNWQGPINISVLVSLYIWVIFHEHSTPLYHFHSLHRDLDIGGWIAADNSSLDIASSQARTGNHWLLSASC